MYFKSEARTGRAFDQWVRVAGGLHANSARRAGIRHRAFMSPGAWHGRWQVASESGSDGLWSRWQSGGPSLDDRVGCWQVVLHLSAGPLLPLRQWIYQLFVADCPPYRVRPQASAVYGPP
jgi:hypothetical protein